MQQKEYKKRIKRRRIKRRRIKNNQTNKPFIFIFICMNNEPSLFIPCIDNNVSNEQIRRTMSCFGVVKQIRTIKTFHSNVCNKETELKNIIVHFRQWRTNPRTLSIRKALMDGHCIKLVHSLTTFWKIYVNKRPTTAA